jgi:Flp pilus assembly protein TadG
VIRREDGQALIEFALIAPVLAILLFGIIDFATAFNYVNDETNLANVAARYGAVIGTATSTPVCGGSNTTNAYEYINCVAASDSKAFNGVLGVCVNDETNAAGTANAWTAGDAVKITVEYPYKFLSIVTSHATVNLTTSSTMMLEANANSGATPQNWISSTNADPQNPASSTAVAQAEGITPCSQIS